MTALVVLVCEGGDSPGTVCGRRSPPVATSAAAARRYWARREGWSVWDGRDYCARCDPDRPPRPKVWPAGGPAPPGPAPT